MDARFYSLVALSLATVTASAELRLHDLPRHKSTEVANAIRVVLPAVCSSEEISCAVAALPDEQMLIEAPAEIQAAIAGIIRDIGERERVSVQRVTLHYWILLATAGSSDDDASLRPLRPVLDDLEEIHGNLQFSIVDRLTLTSIPGDRASLVGERNSSVSQSVQARGGSLTAELGLNFSLPSDGPEPQRQNQYAVQAQIALNRGEFVVLGEATTSTPEAGKLFYIAQWPDN